MYVKRRQNISICQLYCIVFLLTVRQRTSPYSFKRIRIQVRKQDSFDWYRVVSGLSINVDKTKLVNIGAWGAERLNLVGHFGLE